ncbi:hypothetical protein CVT26_002796 [Gymnopilus dilepis]|uniref:Bromo domain-containing protein n=1 Tax=Gymnopilus dilepis TaxID=231916 RepID=A0A409Y385_9AGAR|nr:hypothetical protein CVT26_002796 [Gymnopilus dilepis]
MDESTQSFSHSYSQPASSQSKQTNPAASGLTLVIPSLKSLKAAQSASKAKSRSGSLSHSAPVYHDVEAQERKIPRPIKLKPLKEVLTKLISQLKKKDDYAFFLQPVDVANVPGYSDIVKHPMDLGTMSDKVNRGKYRSLEDFASDFRLVTNNAKMFNPPGSIYHTEAQRLETWGLEHIAKASSTVIQYETDWNIDVEKDDDATPVNIDGDDDDTTTAPTPMDVDSTSLRERSASVVSQPPPVAGPSSRRGPRGPYRRQTQTTTAPGGLSEALEPDGGLPGSKDGLGAFPPGSDWAKTMLALKLKGKRYKTKKERLRFEREGPPLAADGSLDYTEMEDPFSVLSFFVPDPPTRPHLVPLYPPLFNTAASSSHPAQAPPPPSAISHSFSQSQQEPSSSSSHTPRSNFSPAPTSAPNTTTAAPSAAPSAPSSSSSIPPFPSATTVSLDHPDLVIPFLQQLKSETDSSGKSKAPKQDGQQQAPQSSQAQAPGTASASSASLPRSTATTATSAAPRKRRHWTITRNAGSYRSKGKEREEYYGSEFTQDGLGVGSDAIAPGVASWKTPREALPTDFGSFAVLAGALAEEMQRRFGGASTSSSETNPVTTTVPLITTSTPTTTTPTVPYFSYSTFPATLTTTTTTYPTATAPAAAAAAPQASTQTQTQGAASTATDQVKPGSRTDQEVAFDLIRESLDCCESAAKLQSQSQSQILPGMGVGATEGAKGKAGSSARRVNGSAASGPGSAASGASASVKAAEYYFTTQRAAEGEQYLRDLVYGGLEGFAYVRSLAEFVDGDCYYMHKDEEEKEDADMDVDEDRKPSRDAPRHRYNPTLGMPLSQWVVENIVDPLTEGRHSLLREAALELARQRAGHSSSELRQHQYPPGSVAAQVHASLHQYPTALLALSALLQIRLHKIDMGALIKTPNELFLSEEEWYGKKLKERKRKLEEIQGPRNAEVKKVKAEEAVADPDPDAMEVEEEEEEEPEQTFANVTAGVQESAKEGDTNGVPHRSSVTYEQEGPEELSEVLEYVANLIVELDKSIRTGAAPGVNGHSHLTAKQEESATNGTSTTSDEDPLLRHLRLNLLALAKRAPLDTIARLPKDLVPEHIRHFVPTLGSTT